MLYVATDAPKCELEEMGKMLAGSGVYIVSLPPWQEWDQHHWARWLPQNSQVIKTSYVSGCLFWLGSWDSTSEGRWN